MSLSLAPFAGWVSAPDDAVIPNLSSVKEYPGSVRIHSLQARSFDTPEEAAVERAAPLQATSVPVRADRPMK